MSWLILIPLGIAMIALVLFIINRNKKDKEGFESQLNNDFRKSKDEEGDIDAEEILK